MEEYKIYVYAPSMAIVTWASKRWPWSNITIISSNHQIIKFCLKCEICVVKLNPNEDLSLKGLIKYKKYIVKFSKQFTKCNFIFGHNSHDYWGLFLIKCINKNGNKIFYNSQLKEHPKLSFTKMIVARNHLRLFIDSLILLLVLNLRFNVLSFGEYSFLGIDIRRILKKYSQNFTLESDQTFLLNQNHVLCKYNITSIKTLLIDQGEAFYKYTDELIDFIVNFSINKSSIYLKQHPLLLTKNKKLKEILNQVPQEIPAEFLITEETIIIGIASSSMRVVNKTISLLELVEIRPEEKMKYFEFVNHANLLIPKRIVDLQQDLNMLLKL